MFDKACGYALIRHIEVAWISNVGPSWLCFIAGRSWIQVLVGHGLDYVNELKDEARTKQTHAHKNGKRPIFCCHSVALESALCISERILSYDGVASPATTLAYLKKCA